VTLQVEVSCRERIEAAIRAVEEAQRRFNAVTSLRAERALDEATFLDKRDRGRPRGALHGVPVVVKDLFDVADLPTTGGCAAYAGLRAETSSDVVEALRAAGAVVIAKANQHEMGAGATGLVSSFGPVVNPVDPDRIPGGSSSGSAAVIAAGAVPVAIGSDTGGSIRIPASFCGITGLRPTPGRISLAGTQPMSPGYDTAGPMALTARECATVLGALTRVGRPRPADGSAYGVAGIRIGMPEPYFGLLHPDVRRAVEAAGAVFEAMGAVVEWAPGPDVDDDYAGFRHVWADVAHHHRELWDNDKVSPEVARLIAHGRAMSGLDYAASCAAAERVRNQFARALDSFDVLLTPTTPYPAPRVDETAVVVIGGELDVHRGAPSRLTLPVNEARLPAVTFPVGTSEDGLPLGAQVIGPPFSDERLLAVVAAFQEAA
jgi:Asp-tRNA(Asn)/Glu-tRNA(Gln) amidotransferase A subunit family amidase